jgi:acyl-coenzyme A synthetase/AMP-(fatty) acid ligase
VLATVSHRHVYGLLFRILWPLLERRPFATFDCEYPEQLQGEIGSGNALISSPAMLKRIGHLAAGSGRWRAVFSSGGFLPAEAAADVSRVLGVEPNEVLGSTETSGVAWRTPSSAGFELLPSVEVRASAEELLEVRSPFAGVEGWQAMGDRVAFRADGRFELLGRADRVAKIEDKRISLSEIERRLAEHAYVKDAVAVPLEDEARQYVGAVVELTAAGLEALAARGKRALGTELRAALRGRIDAVALPRAFRFPAAMPVDAQGKRQVAALEQLFARSSES